MKIYKAKPKNPTRFRALHRASSGESESQDPTIVWRALRNNERSPFTRGLSARKKNNDTISAYQHVLKGSKPSVGDNSSYISGTRSFKVAAAWAASAHEEDKSRGRLAQFYFDKSAEDYDLTTEEDRLKMMMNHWRSSAAQTSTSQETVAVRENAANAGLAVTFAKSSQEILKRHAVSPEDIIETFIARHMNKKEVKDYQSSGKILPDHKVVRTRARTHDVPRFIKVMPESLYYLNKAKEKWMKMPEEVAAKVGEQIESPFDMDYITTKKEYKKYNAQVRDIIKKIQQK